MQKVKRKFSNVADRACSWIVVLLSRNCIRLAAACVLAVTCSLGTINVVAAANEYDGFLHFVRVCAPALPPPRNKLSVEQQAEFNAVWTQVGIAGKKLESVWEQALQNDPLMRRALKACDRSIQLEMQYNDLSIQLRAEYGATNFRAMEAKWADWSKTRSNQWLDLEDRDLIRLTIWVLSYDGDQSWLQREPFPRLTTQLKRREQDLFSQFVENAIRNQRGALNRDERLSQLMLTQYARLSEDDVVELYQAGIQWMRQQNRNKSVPEIPLRMQQYLKLRAEADYLFEAGDTYLRMTPRPEVEMAEQEFTRLVKKAAVLRPDLKATLAEVHQSQL